MIVYFADRNQNVKGQASTGLPSGLIIVDDVKTEDVDTGVASFDLTISYEPKDRLALEQMTEAGNYVFRSSGTDAECYTIIDAETNSKAKERHLYCEDAGLDLLNVECGPFEAPSAQGIAWYVNQFAGSSGFTVGRNEIPSLTRTLYWDGEQTGTERIRSLARQFDDAEISYRFTIENMSITNRYIDIWKKRGVDINQELRLDRDINNIIVKRSVANLITAVFPQGNTLEGEDEPLDLIGAPAYDDGDIYLDRNTGILYSRKGRAKWARPNGGFILGRWTYDTESQTELKNRAVNYLKRFSDIEVNYEVDIVRGLENTHIGDRINIVDDAGEIYVSGRILKLETSVTGNYKNATLGEYLIKTSGIATQVLQLAADFQAGIAQNKSLVHSVNILAETVDSMYTLEVQSNLNYVNNTAELKAHLYNGNKEVTNEFTEAQFKWILRKESGEYLLDRGYTYNADLEEIGYAGTILCRFIRPELYDLTDHNLITITDHNGNPIQVSYAGLYAQPVVRRANKLRALNKASNTTNLLTASPDETGYPTLAREVNLYEHEGLEKRLEPITQHFWTDNNGAHITEVDRTSYIDNPDQAGGNLLARSDGLYLRDGVKTLASFKSDKVSIGENSDSAEVAFCGGEARLFRSTLYVEDREVPSMRLVAMSPIEESELETAARRSYSSGGHALCRFAALRDSSDARLQAAIESGKLAYVHNTSTSNYSQVEIGANFTGDVFPKIYLHQSSTDKTARIVNIDRFTSPVALTVISDRRLKDHVSYLDTDAVDFVRKLKPAKFKINGKVSLGFYAQEVQDVNNTGAELTPLIGDYFGLTYEELIAPLVRYCQELEKRIEQLEGK